MSNEPYTPLISIIITVLNGAETIAETLKSISIQSFENYELVVIDGGSKDATVSIINRSTVSNKILKVIPGLGLYAGLNEGVRTSRGQWLYFMGADDQLYDENVLRNVADHIINRKPGVKVIVGNVECVKQGYKLYPMFGSPYLMRHQVHHQGMFYSRDLFEQLQYDESLRISSDYELNLKLALNGVAHQSMNLVVCNFGGDGVSENQLSQGYMEMQKVHKRLYNGWMKTWIVGYFWFRRRVGAVIRRYNLITLRTKLKRVFG